MNDCEKKDWRFWEYNPLPQSHETFALMKRCSHNYPFRPEKRRFGDQETGPFFYHYREHGYVKSVAVDEAKKWRELGYNARVTMTKERGTWGARHQWQRGSKHYHVWVGEKQR
jgi:hypothetical protein